MEDFICPVCGQSLADCGKFYRCESNHSFDKAKEGYVNLVLQGGSHGDDKAMVKARRDFLNKGYYEHFANALSLAMKRAADQKVKLLDSGCGEGYYTNKFAKILPDGSEIYGIDISKNALKYAGRKLDKANCKLAVASAYELPFAEKSFDIIVDIFSPLALDEFKRVLTDNGYLILGIADKNHLYELKKAVYENPYQNELSDFEIPGFELAENISASQKITLDSNEDIKNLFEMTPYAHKTSQKDIQKLDRLKVLTVSADFLVLVYKKKQ